MTTQRPNKKGQLSKQSEEPRDEWGLTARQKADAKAVIEAKINGTFGNHWSADSAFAANGVA